MPPGALARHRGGEYGRGAATAEERVHRIASALAWTPTRRQPLVVAGITPPNLPAMVPM
jgi:hypothetical protein